MYAALIELHRQAFAKAADQYKKRIETRQTKLTSTRLEPRDSISNNARAIMMMMLADSLLLQLHAREILSSSQSQCRNSRRRKKMLRRRCRSHITIIEMTCRRRGHNVRSSIADIAVSHQLREVEKAFRSGARGRVGGNVMVMVVVIGLASHGRSSMDHRRGLWCRQQSHTCSRDSATRPCHMCVCSTTRGEGRQGNICSSYRTNKAKAKQTVHAKRTRQIKARSRALKSTPASREESGSSIVRPRASNG